MRLACRPLTCSQHHGRPVQELRNSWGKLYFVFSSKRVHGLHPFANLKALGKVLADSKALLDAMAKSRYLPGVMRKYDEVEKLLAGLLDRVESVEICQVSRAAYAVTSPLASSTCR